ncbi:MAG TPA: EamA family transporter [Azospirillaceae bacterium]|nr:EamA family transporter [Azospirillaceae bacterium]
MTTVAHPLSHRPAVRRATAIGGTAILMWATLALFTTMTGGIPPFQMVAMAFAVAFLVGTVFSLARGQGAFRHLKQRPVVWALGIGGLFGYHFFYFLALRAAPPVEANLLNYLWPLLIVVFSGFLPGERLRLPHALGALAGLAGTALLVTEGGLSGIKAEYLPGYLSAVACAVTWAAYSVLSRLFGSVPTDAVGGFCLATSLLAAVCHFVFETTVVPQGTEWLAVLLLGLGPVGAAFFVWDHGVKHGDIKALGALSYATPLLSTFLLIVSGRAQAGLTVWIACTLIVGGAILASRDLMSRKDPA